MRHVFLVHSAITYLVSRGVIRHLELAPDACAYVLLRNAQPDPDDPVRARLALAASPAVSITWRLGAVWGRISAFDRQIDALTNGEEFAIYVPHLDNAVARLLYTHRRCRQLNYIEEGTAAYMRVEWFKRPFSLREDVLRPLVGRGRYPALGFYPSVYEQAYGLHAAAFPDLVRKTVLPLPFRRIQVTPAPSGQLILVLDALIEFNMVSPAALRDALHTLFAHLHAQGQRQILYKYHPVQGRQPERRAFYETEIFEPWRDRLSLTEFTAPVALEDVALSYPTTEFAIICSSAGLYARFCGCRVVSVARRLMAADTRFATRMQTMPEVFFSELEVI